MHAALAAEKARRRFILAPFWRQLGAGVALVALAGTTYFASPISPLRSTTRPAFTATIPAISTAVVIPTITPTWTPVASATAQPRVTVMAVTTPLASATRPIRRTAEPTEALDAGNLLTRSPLPTASLTPRPNPTLKRGIESNRAANSNTIGDSVACHCTGAGSQCRARHRRFTFYPNCRRVASDRNQHAGQALAHAGPNRDLDSGTVCDTVRPWPTGTANASAQCHAFARHPHDDGGVYRHAACSSAQSYAGIGQDCQAGNYRQCGRCSSSLGIAARPQSQPGAGIAGRDQGMAPERASAHTAPATVTGRMPSPESKRSPSLRCDGLLLGLRFRDCEGLLRAGQPGIKRVAQAVAEVVERQHDQGHADGRRQQQPRLRVDGRLTV